MHCPKYNIVNVTGPGPPGRDAENIDSNSSSVKMVKQGGRVAAHLAGADIAAASCNKNATRMQQTATCCNENASICIMLEQSASGCNKSIATRDRVGPNAVRRPRRGGQQVVSELHPSGGSGDTGRRWQGGPLPGHGWRGAGASFRRRPSRPVRASPSAVGGIKHRNRMARD